MRLIDADALPRYTGYALSADEVAKAVENAPTIEAEPIRRGRWVDHQYKEFPIGRYECSVCGARHDMPWDYCPNCGARMEGEE